MSEYEKLWSAWTSGQVSASQFLAHLQDEVFVAWLKKRGLFYLELFDRPSAPSR